jgi:hypothetical protein
MVADQDRLSHGADQLSQHAFARQQGRRTHVEAVEIKQIDRATGRLVATFDNGSAHLIEKSAGRG